MLNLLNAIDPDKIRRTLEITGKGMLAIFIVMLVLFLSVKALHYFTNKPGKEDSEEKE